jgi:hypothetical protein
MDWIEKEQEFNIRRGLAIPEKTIPLPEREIRANGRDKQRKPKSKKRRRHSDRKGVVKSFRNKKERLRRTQTESATAVL